MQYKSFFKSELKNLKEQGLYRDFRNIDRPIKSFPNADESFKNKEREWLKVENANNNNDTRGSVSSVSYL